MPRLGPRAIEAALMALLDERGTATATIAEAARRLAPQGWRTVVPAVRAAAVRLQKRGKLDAYQHGRPIEVARSRGAIALRAKVAELDYREHPERYVIGRGEQGVLTVEPYKSELLPLWRFKSPAIARTSAAALYRAFLAYGRAGDFVGMDMARKFLQMGWTRARRYANHPSGKKYGAGRRVLARDAGQLVGEKAQAAEIFRGYYDRARAHRTYARLRAAFLRR